MTRRELNLAIFEGRANAVLWQPRLETWISHHREKGTLPARFRDLDNLGIYDALGCSVRYAAHAGLGDSPGPEVEHEERHEGSYFISLWRTPRGELRTVHQEVWEDGKLVNRRIHQYPVQTKEQLLILADLMDRYQPSSNLQDFQRAAERAGQRCEPTLGFSSSGFTNLIKWWCGLTDTFYLLADHPAEVEAYLEACDRRDDRLLEEALKLPGRIFHLYDHATNEFSPPPILKKYLLPRWQKLSARLHAENRFVHSHWDGNSRTILPFLQESGLDGVEALTPLPMGDITLEEIKAAVGDKIVCLDLLPAIHFLEHYSLSECLDFAKRVMDMFAPRLILGVSDEISASGQIEKIEAITELVRDTCGLAE